MDAGLKRAFTLTEGRHGIDDSGARIGRALGLEVITFGRNEWLGEKNDDIPVAASGAGADVPMITATDISKNTVLLTGFHGDKAWNRQVKDTSENIVRGDNTGQGLTEWRLWTGTLHAPVPFLGIRSMPRINAISNDKSMLPWHIKGSYYSRPICRRLLEELGIPRDWFGMKKAAIATGVFERSITPSTRRQMNRWMWDNRDYWLKRKKLPPALYVRGWEIMTRPVMVDPARLTRTILAISCILPPKHRPGRVSTVKAIGRLQHRLRPKRPTVAFTIATMTDRYLRPGQ